MARGRAVEEKEAGIIFEIACPRCTAAAAAATTTTTTPAMFLSTSATPVENRMRKAMPARYHDKRTDHIFLRRGCLHYILSLMFLPASRTLEARNDASLPATLLTSHRNQALLFARNTSPPRPLPPSLFDDRNNSVISRVILNSVNSTRVFSRRFVIVLGFLQNINVTIFCVLLQFINYLQFIICTLLIYYTFIIYDISV